MVRAGLFSGCFAFLALAALPAAAQQRAPGSGVIVLKPPPVQSQAAEPAPAASPYPMTYAEQMAQSLGVRDGGMNLTRPSANPYTPSVSFNGNMLRLRWRP